MSIQIQQAEELLSMQALSGEVKLALWANVEEAKALSICDEATFGQGTAIYRHAKDLLKLIDGTRKMILEPYKQKTNAINDRAKELSEPLLQIEAIIKQKTGSYTLALKRAKEAQIQEEREAAAFFGCTEQVYVAMPENTIRGNGAYAYTKLEKQFKVNDITKVPFKYLVVDERAIKNDIKLGIIEIPGIEIFETETTKLVSR